MYEHSPYQRQLITMATDNDSFQFQLLARDILQEIKDTSKVTTELFDKWGMLGRMEFKSFSYNKYYQKYEKDIFTKDFFKSDVVNSNIQVLTPMGEWKPLNMSHSIDNTSVEEIDSTTLSMTFFDRLYSSGIVRNTGSIVKCFDEMMDDFLISDELKKMLLMEDSDNYNLYNEKEKNEFLFKVFRHLVLGGPVNQYEDTVDPYLNTTKLLYKKLLLVVKDPNTQELSIASHVLNVQAKAGNALVFPMTTDHTQSFCYLIIDNVKRHVTVWYHIWS